MPNLFDGQYGNLASMGRYGDTMLAHINPQEAGLLKSMGGAGTINPQTGLPEFYFIPPQITPPPPPSLGQALNPEAAQAASRLLTKITVPEERNVGKGGVRLAYEKVNPEFDQYANKEYRGQAGINITGYTVPTTQTLQGKPLVAQYDQQGNFKYFEIAGGDVLYPDPNQPNIAASPKINAKGEMIDYGVFDVTQQDDGGFGSFLGDLVSDFGPMILAGLGANFAAGNLGSLFAGGAPATGATAANALGGAVGAGSTELLASLTPAQVAGAGGLLSGGGPLSAPTGQLGADILTGEMAASAIDPLAAANISGGLTTDAVTKAAAAANAAGGSVSPSMLQSIANATGIDVGTLKTFAPSVIQGLIGAGGSYLTADKAKDAAQTQADAQIRAAQIAADAARFRPVGVTTRFGSSKFKTDAQGNVIEAGYTPSAEITGYQDRLRTLAGQGLTDVEAARTAYQPLTGAAQNLFTLGQSYLAKTPEQAAQEYITKQQALLAPSQENQLALLQNKLQQQGRGGLSVAQGGNLGATTPEMQAYYNSIAQSNLALAAQADQEARNRITYGAGLFDTGANLQNRFYSGQTAAYSPFATAMDTSSGLERLAQVPLDIGRQVGGQVTAGAASAGNLLSQGITSAAGTMAPANAYSLGGNLLAGAANSPVLAGAVNKAFGNTPPAQQTFTFDPRTGQYVPVQSAFAT